MLARVGGGNSGIAEYLVTGNKLGRELSRDELDNRVVLDGDLNITDSIINSIDDKGQERYKHITLSFKEDYVDEKTLLAVVEEYKKYLFSAYKEDEYNFYAEAHLPKIKQTINNKTGELIERKPHIHIVIPKVNLLTGKHLNPFGLYESNIQSFQAIQEKINTDHDLMSPTEYVRTTSNNKEQVLARVTGSLLSEKNNKIKQEIAEYVIKNNINSYDEFNNYLSSLGEVKTRNQGKENEYMAIKLPNENRFINLKSPVFSKNFIEKGILKHEKMPIDVIEKHLKEWVDTRSLEVKHIANASAKVKAIYKDLGFKDKQHFLTEREKNYEQRYRGNKKANNQSYATSLGRKNLPVFTRGVQELPKLKLDSRERGQNRPYKVAINELLYGHAVDNMGNKQSQRLSNMRWSDISSKAHDDGRGRGVKTSSLLDQLVLDNAETETLNKDFEKKHYADIRQNLRADLLLEKLKESHLLMDNYQISSAKDGSQRIKVNNRNYNVSDFLTKVMNLTWGEAKIILDDVYNDQLANPDRQITHIETPLKLTNKALWLEFKNERLPQLKAEYKLQIQAIRDDYKGKRQQVFNNYLHEKQLLKSNKNLPKEIKKAKRSIAIFEKTKALKLLNKEYKEQIALFKENQPSNTYYFNQFKEQYNMGILDKYTTADDLIISTGEEALKEQVERVKRSKLNVKELLETSFYRVGGTDKNGNVEYLLKNGEKAFTDTGNKIYVNKSGINEEKVLAALEMATAKYGNSLSLSGNNKFKEMLIDVASRTGKEITLKPEKYNEMLECTKELNQLQEKLEKTSDFNEITDIVQELEKNYMARVENLGNNTLSDKVTEMLQQSANKYKEIVKGLEDKVINDYPDRMDMLKDEIKQATTIEKVSDIVDHALKVSGYKGLYLEDSYAEQMEQLQKEGGSEELIALFAEAEEKYQELNKEQEIEVETSSKDDGLEL